MSGDDGLQLLYAIGALVLVASSFAARRVPLGQALRLALVWVAIFAAGALLFAFKDEIGDRLRTAFNPEAGVVAGETLRVPMGPDGHFHVRAEVNGTPVRFLVDSGATTTGLSRAAAEAAQVRTGSGFGVAIETANGTIVARRVRLEELRVGPIVRRDLPAITAAEFGDTNVLGMNFLSSLSGWGVEGRTLVLRP